MQTFDAVLFDLDGTLIDSAATIFNTMEHTLAHYNVYGKRAELDFCLGPPMRASLARYVPADKVEEALGIYRAEYEAHQMLKSKLYPGVAALLSQMKAQGYKLAVATSKPQIYAQKILEHCGANGYFDVIAGAVLGTGLDTKEAVVRSALAHPAIVGHSAVMVGDRMYDMEGAAQCNLPAIGVLYGYGTLEELAPFAPVAMAESVQELGELLCKYYKSEDEAK